MAALGCSDAVAYGSRRERRTQEGSELDCKNVEASDYRWIACERLSSNCRQLPSSDREPIGRREFAVVVIRDEHQRLPVQLIGEQTDPFGVAERCACGR